MAFIGHMQNFFVDGVDVVALLQRHVSAEHYPPADAAPAHSVLANTGHLTYRERPIPVNPVTLRAGPVDMAYLGLPTFNLSHGNATLKLMFKTLVSVVLSYRCVVVNQSINQSPFDNNTTTYKAP